MTAANMKGETEKNNETATLLKTDIANLPPENILIILSYLTPEDLRSIISCCLRWKTALGYDYIWIKLCKREDYHEVEESRRSKFYNNFLERYNYWQGVYWYNYTLRQNWIKGHYKEFIHEIKAPCNHLFWWFSDDVFVVRNMCRRKLYVYNLNFSKFKRTVISLRQELYFNGEQIMKSGNYLSHFVTNHSLTVWDYGKERTVFDEFWNHVTDVYVFKNLFVLQIQNNENFQVLNVESRQIEYESRGILRNLVIMDGRIVFLTPDHVIHVLKWEDKSLVTFTCCLYQRKGLHKFMVENDLLLSFCKDDNVFSDIPSKLCVWNISTKTKLYSINLKDLCMGEASFINNYLYLNYFQGRDDNNFLEEFQLLDYTKGTMIVSVRNLDTTALVSNDQFIIACRSRMLSLWCLKTKDFVSDLDFTLRNYYVHHTNMVMTRTTLAYAIKGGYDSVFLHVRDYEY